MNEQIIRSVVEQVLAQVQITKNEPVKIPIGVSARHIHLSQKHVYALFGAGYELTVKNSLSQSGQFAANEKLTIVGPKSSIHNVRVLGPAREFSQVEISATDARTLGIDAPLRYSGNIKNSAPITIVGPNGSIFLQEGCIVAAAHIHISPIEAQKLQVVDGQFVNVRVLSPRPIVFNKVKIRISKQFQLEMHVDTDEGNAAMIDKQTVGEIIATEASIIDEVPSSKPTVKEVINKKLLTEKDMVTWQGGDLYISRKTIITALAQDKARQRNIKIVRQ